MGHLILIFFCFVFYCTFTNGSPSLFISMVGQGKSWGFFLNLLPVSCVDDFAGFNINYTTLRDLVQHSLHFVLWTVLSTYTSTNNRRGKLVHPLNTRAFTRTVAVYRVQTGFPLSSKLTLYYDHVELKLGNDAHVPH